MAEVKYAKVKITNNAPGPRVFHTRDGQVQVAPGTTSQPLHMSHGELEDAANNTDYLISDGDAPDPVNPSDAYPEDLRAAKARDGLVSKDKLLEIAQAEGVEVKADDSKAEIADKIVAKRAADAD